MVDKLLDIICYNVFLDIGMICYHKQLVFEMIFKKKIKRDIFFIIKQVSYTLLYKPVQFINIIFLIEKIISKNPSINTNIFKNQEPRF